MEGNRQNKKWISYLYFFLAWKSTKYQLNIQHTLFWEKKKKHDICVFCVNNKMANYLLHIFLWIPPKRSSFFQNGPKKIKNEMKWKKIPQISIFVSQPNIKAFFGPDFFLILLWRNRNVHIDRKKNQSIYIETNGQCMNDINTKRAHWIIVSNCMTK